MLRLNTRFFLNSKKVDSLDRLLDMLYALDSLEFIEQTCGTFHTSYLNGIRAQGGRYGSVARVALAGRPTFFSGVTSGAGLTCLSPQLQGVGRA